MSKLAPLVSDRASNRFRAVLRTDDEARYSRDIAEIQPRYSRDIFRAVLRTDDEALPAEWYLGD